MSYVMVMQSCGVSIVFPACAWNAFATGPPPLKLFRVEIWHASLNMDVRFLVVFVILMYAFWEIASIMAFRYSAGVVGLFCSLSIWY